MQYFKRAHIMQMCIKQQTWNATGVIYSKCTYLICGALREHSYEKYVSVKISIISMPASFWRRVRFCFCFFFYTYLNFFGLNHERTVSKMSCHNLCEKHMISTLLAPPHIQHTILYITRSFEDVWCIILRIHKTCPARYATSAFRPKGGLLNYEYARLAFAPPRNIILFLPFFCCCWHPSRISQNT